MRFFGARTPPPPPQSWYIGAQSASRQFLDVGQPKMDLVKLYQKGENWGKNDIQNLATR